MGAKMSKRAVKAIKLNRISLNLTVSGKVSKIAWKHLLDSVEKFEKDNGTSVIDLDMRSLPFVSSR